MNSERFCHVERATQELVAYRMISERDCPVERAVNKVCAPHFQQDNTVPSDNVPLVPSVAMHNLLVSTG